MLSLIQRNLKLFFYNRSGIVFSILGALISFLLYIIFLKQGMIQDWSAVPSHKSLLDLWLMGGTLAITAITTTLSALEQMVTDKEKSVVQDFYITGTSPFKIAASYFISATIIGFLMQLILFVIMTGYFYVTDHITISAPTTIRFIGLLGISALVGATLNFLLVMYINREATMAKLGTIVGTAAGFFMGVYIPIGTLPNFASFLIKLYPGAYLASLNRRVLMQQQLQSSFSRLPAKLQPNFEEKMGLGYTWHSLTTFNQDLSIVAGVFVLSLLVIWGLPKLIQHSQLLNLE